MDNTQHFENTQHWWGQKRHDWGDYKKDKKGKYLKGEDGKMILKDGIKANSRETEVAKDLTKLADAKRAYGEAYGTWVDKGEQQKDKGKVEKALRKYVGIKKKIEILQEDPEDQLPFEMPRPITLEKLEQSKFGTEKLEEAILKYKNDEKTLSDHLMMIQIKDAMKDPLTRLIYEEVTKTVSRFWQTEEGARRKKEVAWAYTQDKRHKKTEGKGQVSKFDPAEYEDATIRGWDSRNTAMANSLYGHLVSGLTTKNDLLQRMHTEEPEEVMDTEEPRRNMTKDIVKGLKKVAKKRMQPKVTPENYKEKLSNIEQLHYEKDYRDREAENSKKNSKKKKKKKGKDKDKDKDKDEKETGWDSAKRILNNRKNFMVNSVKKAVRSKDRSKENSNESKETGADDSNLNRHIDHHSEYDSDADLKVKKEKANGKRRKLRAAKAAEEVNVASTLKKNGDLVFDDDDMNTDGTIKKRKVRGPAGRSSSDEGSASSASSDDEEDDDDAGVAKPDPSVRQQEAKQKAASSDDDDDIVADPSTEVVYGHPERKSEFNFSSELFAELHHKNRNQWRL